MLRAFEWKALFIFHVWLIYLSAVLVLPFDWHTIVWSLVALPLGIFFADLLTGLIHWALDSIGNSTTPIWGPMLAKPFRDHHREPLKITRISLAENLGSSAISGLIVLVLTTSFISSRESHVFLSWLLLWFVSFSVWSNLFHRWSHIPRSRQPHWMKVLQTKGILLSAHEHAIHHRKPHRVNYCILNGWANGFTNRVPWARLEVALKAVGVRIDFE